MSKKTIFIAFITVIALVLIGWGGIALTSGPAFCGSCHVMQPFKETHAQGIHQKASCSDCHVPHAIFSKIAYKIKSGTRDIYHNVRKDYPEVITLKEDSKNIVMQNCARCHAKIIGNVDLPLPNKPCYTCHRNVAHPGLKM